MIAVQSGNRAEQAAAKFLVRHGYRIHERNFRRPCCEIDIIAERQESLYFVQVKYRQTDQFGDGFANITTGKIQYIQRAVLVWPASHNWTGDCSLSAIAVSSPHYEVDAFIEELVT